MLFTEAARRAARKFFHREIAWVVPGRRRTGSEHDSVGPQGIGIADVVDPALDARACHPAKCSPDGGWVDGVAGLQAAVCRVDDEAEPGNPGRHGLRLSGIGVDDGAGVPGGR